MSLERDIAAYAKKTGLTTEEVRELIQQTALKHVEKSGLATPIRQPKDEER